MTNFEKIMIISVCVLAVIVLVVSAIVFRQQKIINTLAGNTGTLSTQTSANKNALSLPEITKQFSGKIENISGSQLTVGARLSDFSKPKNSEKFNNPKEPINITGSDFESIEKEVTVNTSEKTVFANKKLSELKVGDTVSINSDKSPYKTNTVMAEEVTLIKPAE